MRRHTPQYLDVGFGIWDLGHTDTRNPKSDIEILRGIFI